MAQPSHVLLAMGADEDRARSSLRFTLGRTELQYWSPKSKRWVVEPSGFDVWVGEDSRADLHAALTIEP